MDKNELLKELEIDSSLGYQDMLAELADKAGECLERMQTTTNPENAKRYEQILEAIDAVSAEIQEAIKNADYGLVLEDTPEPAPAPASEKKAEPKPAAPEPEDDTEERLAAIRKREQEKADKVATQSVPAEKKSAPVPEPASKPPLGSALANTAAAAAPAPQKPAEPLTPEQELQKAMKDFASRNYQTAFPLLSRLANADSPSPEAMHLLSVAYHDGLGCAKDWNAFEFWSKKASDLGEVQSCMYRAGVLFKEAVQYAANCRSNTETGFYKEGFALYEKAAELSQDPAKKQFLQNAMKAYVSMAELYFQNPNDVRNLNIKSCITAEIITKAKEYCGKIAELSNDAYEKKKWQESESEFGSVKLKNVGKSENTSVPVMNTVSSVTVQPSRKKGCFPIGCAAVVIIGAIAAAPVMKVLFPTSHKTAQKTESSSVDEVVETLEASSAGDGEEDVTTSLSVQQRMGKESVDVMKIQDEDNVFYNVENVSKVATEYILDGVSWKVNAINCKPPSNTDSHVDFQLNGKIGSLSFRMTPYLEFGHFDSDAAARVSVVNNDNGEVLYDTRLTGQPAVTEAVVDVTDIQSIRLVVARDDSTRYKDSDILFRTMYLNPPGMEPPADEIVLPEPAAPKEGVEKISLTDNPGVITDSNNFNDSESDYILDGVSWRAGAKEAKPSYNKNAYLELKTAGKYGKLRFKYTPDLDKGRFHAKSKARVSVIDLDNGAVLYDLIIGPEATANEAAVVITDVQSVRLVVSNLTGSYNSYVLFRDMSLEPV